MSDQFTLNAESNGTEAIPLNNTFAQQNGEPDRALLLETLLALSPDAILVINSNGAITEVNASACRLLGYSSEELAGKAIVDLIAPDEQSRLVALQETCVEGITQTTLYTCLHKDGSRLRVEVNYKILAGNWWVLLVRDLDETERQPVQATETAQPLPDLIAAANKIAYSEQQLRRVLDSLFSFVGVMTPDGILIEANRAALEAAQLKPEDVLGKPFWEAYWWSFSFESQSQLQAAICRAAAGESVRYDVQVRLGDDLFIIIDFAIVPLSNDTGQVEYLIPSGIDITERKQSELALQQNEATTRQQLAEIESIYATAPIGLCFIDTDLRFVRINEQMAEINGLPVAEHLGRTLRDVLPEMADDLEPLYRQVIESKQPIFNLETHGTNRAQPGVERYWLVSYSPQMGADGQVLGVNVIVQEITEQVRVENERKQAEFEREQLLSREQTARQEAERLNRLKDDFFSALSHELRTPLNPILGWTKLLKDQKLPPAKVTHALETIERNVKHQISLVDDLLDISSIIQGKLRFSLKSVDLASILHRAVQTVEFAAQAKSIALLSNHPEPTYTMGDSDRLVQVFWNLLSNAIKFTPEGGQVNVQLSVHQGDASRYAQVCISDTGIGIAPDFMPHIFEYFRQAEGGSTRRYSGLGLGLAIVRHLVELHGGTITAESAGLNQGSMFIVKLPLLSERDLTQMLSSREADSANSSVDSTNSVSTGEFNSSTPLLPPTESTSISESLAGIQIVVVDDEPDNLELLRFLLTQEGAVVTDCLSPLEALQLIAQRSPDLIISDIAMPEMEGYEFIQQVRALPSQRATPTPAIALTAFAQSVDRERAIAAGFQRYISKPIDPSVIIETITELMF